MMEQKIDLYGGRYFYFHESENEWKNWGFPIDDERRRRRGIGGRGG